MNEANARFDADLTAAGFHLYTRRRGPRILCPSVTTAQPRRAQAATSVPTVALRYLGNLYHVYPHHPDLDGPLPDAATEEGGPDHADR